MTKELTCIECPNGCKLTITINGDDILVEGNTCNKGKDFAITEMTNPTRTICSTVKTTFKNVPVVSVKVNKPIPKDMIFPCMEEINKVLVTSKMSIGDVVIKNILNLDVDVVITSNDLMSE